MSKTRLLLPFRWFRINDKWHTESLVHAKEEGANKSICGRLEISEVNQDSVVEFANAGKLPLGALCGMCLRRVL